MRKRSDNSKTGEDEIVLAPSDLKKGMRGVFAHRLGEQAEDEGRVARFWQSCGLEVEQLEKGRDVFSRLPDFRLIQDGKPFAYCEAKTVWHHTRVIRIMNGENLVEEREEASTSPVKERIGTDLVTAARQLRYENAEHVLFNFVFLVNQDKDARPEHVEMLLSGEAPERLKSNLDSFRRDVDLCFWAVPIENGRVLVERCFLLNPNLRSFAEEITGMRRDRVIPLEPAA